MKKIILSILIISTTILITSCGKKNETKNQNTTITTTTTKIIKVDTNSPIGNKNKEVESKVIESYLVNCKDCVFSFFTDNKTFGSTITGYTSKYATLKDEAGYQRRRFLGFVLDGNNISKAYACAIKDKKAFCLEGATDNHAYEYNKEILNQIYDSSQCRYLDNEKTYACTDGYTNGTASSNGNVSVYYDEICQINGSTNEINCK